MKILIVTATIGQGHNTVAYNLRQQFKKMGHQVKVLDMYSSVNRALKKAISGGYILSINAVARTRRVGEFYYATSERVYKSPTKYSITTKVVARAVKKEVDNFAPDGIICTQVNCMQIIDYLKGKGEIDCFTSGIITDFTVQSMWRETKNTDNIFTASYIMNGELAAKSVDVRKVKAFGIPINTKFEKRMSKSVAKERLGLDQSPVVLLCGGSMGYGKILKTIKEMDKEPFEFQIVAICGCNKSLRTKLLKLKTKHSLYVHGFTPNVSLLMDACDIVVTKPGGLSLSEALAKSLPIVLMSGIPGMEDKNKDFIVNNGLALGVNGDYSAHEAVMHLLDNEDRRLELIQNVKKFKRKNSTANVCDFVVESVKKQG